MCELCTDIYECKVGNVLYVMKDKFTMELVTVNLRGVNSFLLER